MNRRTSRRKIEPNHTDIRKVCTLGYYRQRLIIVKVQVRNLQNPSKSPVCVNNYLLYRVFYSCALIFPHHSKRKLFGLKTDALVVWQLQWRTKILGTVMENLPSTSLTYQMFRCSIMYTSLTTRIPRLALPSPLQTMLGWRNTFRTG